jgi:hypothetical protein
VDRVELRQIAAAHEIATGRFDAAAGLLRPVLASNPGDAETQFLMLHVLFASALKGASPGATSDGQAEWQDLAPRYVAAGGRHRAIVDEWRAYLTSTAAASP